MHDGSGAVRRGALRVDDVDAILRRPDGIHLTTQERPWPPRMSSQPLKPTSQRDRGRWPLILAIAALLAGCGGGKDDTTAATPAETATPGLKQPHIESPENGAVVPATAELGDSRGAKIKVTGSAQPNARVVVSTGCQSAGCSTAVKTGADGTFSATVSAGTKEADHLATIVVDYGNGDVDTSDRIVVTIGPQGSASEAATPRTRKRQRKKARSTPTPLPSVTVVPPASTPRPEVTAPPTTAGSGEAGSLVVIGDSLAQGMQPYLNAALPGWKISVDASIGRPLAEGMKIFSATSIKPNTIYAFSLFTNDDPRSTSALGAAVRDSVQRGGCAVWATIVRPPVGGVSYNAANQQIKQLASSLGARLQIVDWAGAVAQHPEWIAGSDGVHATATGYRNRATLYAQAIQRCS